MSALRVGSGSPWEAVVGYSRVIVRGDARVHGEVFGGIRPATSMVEVSALIDPALLVEIEADAVRGAGA